ncbi:hypothetical protein K7N18_32960, partial [Burkholderia arboris]|nr:hypothetical protein [Burkholderia arboris]
FVFLSSAAFSAAEKRDYEPCFAARQQLFYYIVATAGLNFRTAEAATTRPSTALLPFPPAPRFR